MRRRTDMMKSLREADDTGTAAVLSRISWPARCDDARESDSRATFGENFFSNWVGARRAMETAGGGYACAIGWRCRRSHDRTLEQQRVCRCHCDYVRPRDVELGRRQSRFRPGWCG